MTDTQVLDQAGQLKAQAAINTQLINTFNKMMVGLFDRPADGQAHHHDEKFLMLFLMGHQLGTTITSAYYDTLLQGALKSAQECVQNPHNGDLIEWVNALRPSSPAPSILLIHPTWKWSYASVATDMDAIEAELKKKQWSELVIADYIESDVTGSIVLKWAFENNVFPTSVQIIQQPGPAGLLEVHRMRQILLSAQYVESSVLKFTLI